MTDQSGSEEKRAKQAWEEVGQQFSSVGKRIGEHYRKIEDEARTSAETQRQTVNEAIKKVVGEMDKAFTGLGNALRDPETKESLSRAAKSLGDALDSTFSGLGERLRKGSTKKGSPSDGPGGAAGQPNS